MPEAENLAEFANITKRAWVAKAVTKGIGPVGDVIGIGISVFQIDHY